MAILAPLREPRDLHFKHLGDVTVVLTKKGRNLGPKNTKLLVTDLLELTARQVQAEVDQDLAESGDAAFWERKVLSP